jgi:competence protein ComEC
MFKHVPLAKILFPYILGVVCYSYIGAFLPDIAMLMFLLPAVIFLWILVLKPQITSYPFSSNILFVLLVLGCFALGFGRSQWIESYYSKNHFSKVSGEHKAYILKLISDPKTKPKSNVAEAEVSEVYAGKTWFSTRGKCLVYLSSTEVSDIRYGDEYLIHNPKILEVSGAGNPGEFNYKRYLSYHQIQHQLFVPSVSFELLNENKGNPLKTYAFRARKKMVDLIEKYIHSHEEIAVASALLLGKKDYLDPELTRAYASAGAMHVLAVSGLHVGIIFIILKTLFFFLENKRKLKLFRGVILILGIWAYAFISGLSPSVVRAATMFSFVAFADIVNKKTNIYNTLCLSAFAILLYNPFMLMEVGMQLSYLAVFGIVYIQPKLYALLKAGSWLGDKIWAITTVSVAAQIATAPLGFLYFHQFPNYFLVSNLLVIPAAFVVLYVGSLFFASYYVFDVFTPWIAWLLQKVIFVLNTGVKFFNQLPFPIIEGIDISISETWLIYMGLFFFFVWEHSPKLKWMNYTLFFVLTFSLFQLFESYTHIKRKNISFFNVRSHEAFVAFSGKESFAFVDDELRKNESKMLFHLWHHLWYNDMNDLPFNAHEPDFAKVFEVNDNRIVILGNSLLLHMRNSQSDFPNINKANFLLVSNNCKLPEALKKNLRVEQCIFDASNYAKFVEREKQFWMSKQAKTHILSETGGMVLNFD